MPELSAFMPESIDLTCSSPVAGYSAPANEALFGDTPVTSPVMADCCRAGLLLAHDWYDASHEVSQDIETSTGSYWHAILHRREPDFSNAKYWFRRVGDHPIYDDLGQQAKNVAVNGNPQAQFLHDQSSWDPFAFVDLCESALAGNESLADICRAVTLLEWKILFTYCWHAAVE